jgi:hypothetical protein
MTYWFIIEHHSISKDILWHIEISSTKLCQLIHTGMSKYIQVYLNTTLDISIQPRISLDKSVCAKTKHCHDVWIWTHDLKHTARLSIPLHYLHFWKNESQCGISMPNIELLIDVTCWLVSDVWSLSSSAGPAGHDITGQGLHFKLNSPEALTRSVALPLGSCNLTRKSVTWDQTLNHKDPLFPS